MFTIIWDLDGTLSNCDPHLHLIQKAPKQWDAWDEMIPHHKPYDDMINLFNIHFYQGHTNLIVTARREKCRAQTEEWLLKQNIHNKHSGLYMRGMKDYRPDFEVKADILKTLRQKGFEPNLAFEDRGSVATMYRDNGVRCFQVVDGQF